jgi:hypothetical protein
MSITLSGYVIVGMTRFDKNGQPQKRFQVEVDAANFASDGEVRDLGDGTLQTEYLLLYRDPDGRFQLVSQTATIGYAVSSPVERVTAERISLEFACEVDTWEIAVSVVAASDDDELLDDEASSSL